MKLWDRIIKGVNPDNEEEPFDEFSDDEVYYGNSDGNAGDMGDFMAQQGGYSPYGNQNNPQSNQGGYMPPQQGYQSSSQPANAGGITVSPNGNTPLSSSFEVKLVKPANYQNVNQIADLLINGKIIILDLTETNKETARRLIDFLGGVTYAKHGNIARASERTFVITPSNTPISPAQIKEEQRKNNTDADNSIY